MVDYTSRTVTKATSRLRDIIFQLFENDDENDDYSCLEFRPNYRIAKTNHFIYIKLLQIKITNCSILILRIVLFFHCSDYLRRPFSNNIGNVHLVWFKSVKSTGRPPASGRIRRKRRKKKPFSLDGLREKSNFESRSWAKQFESTRYRHLRYLFRHL